MPVAQSFGFAGDVRGLSSGRACVSLQFEAWHQVDGEVTEAPEASSATKTKGKRARAGAGAGAGAGASGAAAASTGTSLAAGVVAEVRARKGLDVEVPTAESLSDVL